MKMINKTKTSLFSAAAMGLLLITTVGQAANLTASSVAPFVLFDDTDSVGSEWYIGGFDDEFRVYDYGSSGVVFQILQSNNNLNSMVVDSSGDVNLADGSVFIDRSADMVGIGTTTPEDTFHLKAAAGNIVLEGATATTYSKWQIASLGGGGFWLSDLLNSTRPFRIEGDAPTDSIRIGTAGVGIGTEIPSAKLDVAGDIKSTFSGPNPTGLVELIKLSANNTTAGQFSDAGFSMENAKAGFSWAFRTLENTGGFAASKQGTGAKEFEVRNTTTVASNVELHLANGASNVGGQWLNASSRSYKENINELSSEDAIQALKGLQSVTYEFKRDEENTQRVGFIAEDVPALLATKDKKTVDSLQIISVLTKVAQLQNKALQVQEKSLQETKANVKAKDAKIAEMESKITKLILMQESLAKTMEARFTPFAAESLKVNQQVTSLNRE